MGACQDQKEKIIFYTYNELDAKSGKEVESHLAICEQCQNEQQRLLTLLEALKDTAESPELSPLDVKSLVTNTLKLRNKPRERWWRRYFVFRPSRFIPAVAMACLILITTGIIGYVKLNAPNEFPVISKYQDEIIINDRELEILSNLDLLKEMDTIRILSQVVDLNDEIKSKGEINNDSRGMGQNAYREDYV